MLHNLPDPLKPYISNNYLKYFLYLMSTGIIFIFLSKIEFNLIFASIIVYLAYKNIKNEKIKWGVITLISIAILIFGGGKSKDLSLNNSVNNTTTSTQNILENKEEEFLVTRVIDGDTIEIEGGKRVRYIGIDTPETVDPNRPVGCYGKEASIKNTELVLNKRVKLVKDVSETDKYGRLLRYVFVGDTFVNDYLVKEGYAKASTYAPDVKYSDQFSKSEKDSRESLKGLWGDICNSKPNTQSPQIISTSSLITTSNTEYSSSEVVKKSSTGICHAPGTTYYVKTKNFTAYNSVQECLDSGGRLPLR
jgi:micrococcal nuclease